MKLIPLVLAGSLAANVALVAFLATRMAAPPAPVVFGPKPTAPSSGRNALLAALQSGDRAALEAAGLSPELARELALGRNFSRLAERLRVAQGKSGGDPRWWRNRPGGNNAPASRREVSDALREAFGSDFDLMGGDSSQLAFLPAEKRAALQRILQDYEEMMIKYNAGGIQLASDKEKLRLLKAERDRDIASLLTPEEKLAYEMRTSGTAHTVRNRYGDAIETEGDFQKIYALQKAFDEKFPPESLTGRISPETLRQRAEAQRQLQDDLRAALGDDSYAALRRATDGDLRNVDALATRLNLGAGTTDRVAATRDTLAAESQRINSNAALPALDRRAQIQELATRARNDLAQALGPEAAAAYAQSSPWVSMLQNGMAYSTSPQANALGGLALSGGVGPGVYPVAPSGAAVSGGMVRQVISNGVAPEGDGARRSDHVMTFTATTSDSGATPPPGKAMIIVEPPATTAPAAPPGKQ